jgi:hypothetical protein
MAATGFTPISLYYTTTASAAPTAGNLVAGELAINTNDGILYYKDSSGVVQKIGTKNGVGTSTTTQVLYNSSGSLAGSANMTFSGTALTLANDASISGLTVGKGYGAQTNNTAFGVSALASSSLSQNNNTAIGYQTLIANTSGYQNTALGDRALTATTTGTRNTGLGYVALASNTTGASNTAIGNGAAYTNSTGGSNIAIGDNALFSNTTASNNTAVGYQAGYANTTGTENTYIGRNAGAAITTTGRNTIVGYSAGNGAATGDRITAFGHLAGSVCTGSFNTFLGGSAGRDQTSGTGNSYIGESAGYLMTTGSKNTILGAYGGNSNSLDIRTASNYIVLSDGDGNPRLFSDASGRIIIGTTTQDATSQLYVEAIQSASARGVRFQQGLSSGYTGINIWSTLTGSSDNTSCQHFGGYANGGAKIAIYGNGNIQNTNNSYGSLSDIKLKENIVDATPKLEDLCKVKIRNYNLKSDPSFKQIGVVAQELEEVFAGLVEDTPDRDEEGNALGTTTKQVKYSVFVPMLIKAMQELKAEVDSLKQQLGK